MDNSTRFRVTRISSASLLAAVLGLSLWAGAQQQPAVPTPQPTTPGAPASPPPVAPASEPAAPQNPEAPAPPAVLMPPPPEPPPAIPTFVVEDLDTRAAGEETIKRLRQTMTAELNEAPLKDALAFVSDKVGLDILGDYKALDAAGVSADTPVSVKVTHPAPAEQVLRLILRAAAGDRASYAVEGPLIRVADHATLARAIVVRTYDLSAFGDGEADVVVAITESLAPDSWRDGNHPDRLGSARMVGHRLIVGQSEEVHRQIAKLLKLMAK